MVTADKVLVELEARTAKYMRDVDRAQRDFTRNMGRIDQAARRSEAVVAGAARSMGLALVGAFAGAASFRGAQELVDSATRIENALKVAGLSGEELTRVYDRLFQSAQRNAAPIESLVTLYGRAAIVQKELGVSSEELERFTDNVAVALRVAGTDAQSASGALLQLSQALGAGTVRAEEFSSLLEGALPIAQAAAAGLEEAGGSVAKLRALVVDGKVSSEAFFRAFEAGASTLREKVAAAELTVSQRFVRLRNVLIDVAKDFDGATDASGKTGRALDRLTTAIEAIGSAAARVANGPIGDLISTIGQLDERARSLFGFLSQFSFNDEIADALGSGLAPETGPVTGKDAIIQRIQELKRDRDNMTDVARDLGFTNDEIDAQIREMEDKLAAIYFGSGGPSTRGGKRRVKADKPVTLDKYPVDPSSKDGSRSQKVSEIERERQAVTDYIAELEFERSLIGLANVEREKEIALRRAGAVATPEQRAQIEALTEAIYNERSAIERQKEAFEQLQQIGEDAINGIANAFSDGKIEASEMIQIVGNLIQQLLTMKNIGGAGGGGIFGFLGGLFGGGGGAGDPWAGLRIPSYSEGTGSHPGGLAGTGKGVQI